GGHVDGGGPRLPRCASDRGLAVHDEVGGGSRCQPRSFQLIGIHRAQAGDLVIAGAGGESNAGGSRRTILTSSNTWDLVAAARRSVMKRGRRTGRDAVKH